MLEIGNHQLANNVFLAPMAGITDRPFRDLCAQHGVGYAISEMISSDATLFATRKTQHRVMRANNGLPHVVQIAGASPNDMAAAAAYNVAMGADIIDINMGCPAKKVCRQLAGSALLEHPRQVRSILRSVVASVAVPVTLKIRTGPCPETRNGVAIARLAEQEGIACIAVHGRTRKCRFKGEAEYDTIIAIKQSVSIPVIANGDIRSAADAVRVLQYTGADGVMLGRAAQGNPWVFREVVAALAGLPAPSAPDALEVYKTLVAHLHGLYQLYGEYRGVRIARKHIAWYCKGLRNATAFRRQIYQAESATEQLTVTTRFFEQPEQFDIAA